VNISDLPNESKVKIEYTDDKAIATEKWMKIRIIAPDEWKKLIDVTMEYAYQLVDKTETFEYLGRNPELDGAIRHLMSILGSSFALLGQQDAGYAIAYSVLAAFALGRQAHDLEKMFQHMPTAKAA